LNLIFKKLIEILFFIKAFSITPRYQNYFVFNKIILFGIWKKSLRMYLQIISIYNTQNLSVCVTALFLGFPTLYKLETVVIRSSMNWGISLEKKFSEKWPVAELPKKGYHCFLENFSLNRTIWGSFTSLYLMFTGYNLVLFYILPVLWTGEVPVWL
jgi:hypothetical protein